MSRVHEISQAAPQGQATAPIRSFSFTDPGNLFYVCSKERRRPGQTRAAPSGQGCEQVWPAAAERFEGRMQGRKEPNAQSPCPPSADGTRPRSRFLFLIWFARNPLKSPETDEGIQENPSPFAWFFLGWLGPALDEFGLLPNRSQAVARGETGPRRTPAKPDAAVGPEQPVAGQVCFPGCRNGKSGSRSVDEHRPEETTR